ncbi:MAG: carbohydrate ABC transporter permease, partial [Clostridia bacterium]|nr:carbohydrate ABC transporter permease [Clostridia bacterium]
MKKKKRSAGDIAFTILSRIFILVLALSVAFPLLMTVSVSLQTMNEIYKADPVIIPAKLMFENYKTAMSQGAWPRYFLNSAIVTVITVVISLFINSMSGYVFARIPFKFRNALFALILLGMMIPTQVTLIPVFTLLRKIGFLVG